MEKVLEDKLLHELHAEVVWSRYSSEGCFKMGLKIMGRNHQELDLINQLLASFRDQDKPQPKALGETRLGPTCLE